MTGPSNREATIPDWDSSCTTEKNVNQHLHQPDLCITGHIHEARGKDTVGKTPVYNPGMLRQDGWLTIHVNQSQLEITLI